MMRKLFTLSLIGAAVTLAGCSRQTEKTIMQFMPHMANTPILKAQKGYDGFGNGASVLMPPDHTIPIGHKPYRLTSAEAAAAQLKNPLPFNQFTVQRGREVYNIYCLVCHGERGLGDGPVVDPFPTPKSLHSPDMLRWNDGHLYHIITAGQGVMPPYAQQVQPDDRWAVIHYIRVLQRAQNPTAEDVRELERRKPQN